MTILDINIELRRGQNIYTNVSDRMPMLGSTATKIYGNLPSKIDITDNGFGVRGYITNDEMGTGNDAVLYHNSYVLRTDPYDGDHDDMNTIIELTPSGSGEVCSINVVGTESGELNLFTMNEQGLGYVLNERLTATSASFGDLEFEVSSISATGEVFNLLVINRGSLFKGFWYYSVNIIENILEYNTPYWVTDSKHKVNDVHGTSHDFHKIGNISFGNKSYLTIQANIESNKINDDILYIGYKNVDTSTLPDIEDHDVGVPHGIQLIELWNETAIYKPDDKVSYANKIYTCLVDNTNTLPNDPINAWEFDVNDYGVGLIHGKCVDTRTKIKFISGVIAYAYTLDLNGKPNILVPSSSLQYFVIDLNDYSKLVGGLIPLSGSYIGSLYVGELVGNSTDMRIIPSNPDITDYHASLHDGNLPNGVNITKNGTLQGLPTETGDFAFEIVLSTPDEDIVGSFSLSVIVGIDSTVKKYYASLPRTNLSEWRAVQTYLRDNYDIANNLYRPTDPSFGMMKVPRIPMGYLHPDVVSDGHEPISSLTHIDTVVNLKHRGYTYHASYNTVGELIYYTITLKLDDVVEGYNYFTNTPDAIDPSIIHRDYVTPYYGLWEDDYDSNGDLPFPLGTLKCTSGLMIIKTLLEYEIDKEIHIIDPNDLPIYTRRYDPNLIFKERVREIEYNDVYRGNPDGELTPIKGERITSYDFSMPNWMGTEFKLEMPLLHIKYTDSLTEDLVQDIVEDLNRTYYNKSSNDNTSPFMFDINLKHLEYTSYDNIRNVRLDTFKFKT